MDERIFANAALLKTWLWCLMKANHTGKIWVPVKCGSGRSETQIARGEFIFGRHSAAKELNSSASTIRNHLAKLKELGFLDTKPDSQWTRVIIRDYDHYSGRLEEQGQESCPGKNRKITQLKNEENGEKVKKERKEKGVTKKLPPKRKDLGSDDPLMATSDWIIFHWNEIEGVTQVSGELAPATMTKLEARLREHKTKAWWEEEFFARVRHSDFMRGKKADWCASLGWAMGPINITKILEDRYKGPNGGFRGQAKHGKSGGDAWLEREMAKDKPIDITPKQ